MHNTSGFTNVRLLIYKSREGYTGVCYETGTVDVWPTIEEVKRHLMDGVVALMETVQSGQVSEDVLNTKPSFKYRLLFFILPIVAAFKRSSGISLLEEPITPRALAHA